MRYFLFATHSHLADGFMSSCRYFLPSVENITVLNAYEKDSPDVSRFITDFFARRKEEDEVVVFTDILFGSISQTVMQYVHRPHTHIFTGMNLPLLLDIMTKPDDRYFTEEEMDQFSSSAREGVLYMNHYQVLKSADDE